MCNAICDDCPFEVTRQVDTDFHEIHVTVECDASKFLTVCGAANIKPVLIEMQNENREAIYHLMTSQRLKGTRTEAIEEMKRECSVFEAAGIPVIRAKIESSRREGKEKGYFESHIAFRIPVLHDRNRFERVVKAINERTGETARLSKNAFKRSEDAITWMVTIREYEDVTREEFEKRVVYYAALMRETYGFEADKIIVEFAWFDSNVSLDAEWKF